MQRQNLRNINPWDTIHTRPKYQHVREEKCDARRRRALLHRRAVETEEHCDHHHGDAEAGTAPHHWATAAELVEEEGWDQGAEEEHGVYDAAEEEGEVAG